MYGINKKRAAFTMIELVFVIVVLGILAAIAIPKFAATRTDAIIAKGRSDIASIRSGILSERQTRLIKGETNYITDGNLSTSTTTLFNGVLTYGVSGQNKDGHWHKNAVGDTIYYYKVGGVDVKFKYDSTNGTFTCSGQNSGQAATYCSNLIN